MAFGVFIHRADSIYDDSPAERYQFPNQYLNRAKDFIGDWVVYYEPKRVALTRGYFAVARVQQIIPDPSASGMYLAIIEAGSYLDFPNPVTFSGIGGLTEHGLINSEGRISGRAQSAVRPISIKDFNRFFDLGFAENAAELPRTDSPPLPPGLQDEAIPFQYEESDRDRVNYLGSRIIRDRIFRRVVLQAYDSRCAVTGLRLINGNGRAEVEAAHIQPVEANGPDIISNGLALSGTAHWMFDRGLISASDELEILVSTRVNDVDSVHAMLNQNRFIRAPSRSLDRPHPQFLRWHRENCFKA
jgi:putative restriction endonuclease